MREPIVCGCRLRELLRVVVFCGGIQQIQSNAVRIVLLLESDGNELSTELFWDRVDVHG